MPVIKVSDMMCENCVKHISKALSDAGLKYEVSLENKTVTIDGCEKCVASAVAALKAIDYTPEVVE